MNLFDFFKPEDFEALPEDPQQRFIELVRIADKKLSIVTTQNASEPYMVANANYGYQNIIIAAAKQLHIEGISDFYIPTAENYNDDSYRQFRADLNFYLTQMMLGGVEVDRANSVPLREETKQSIRTYIAHLRIAIDATEMAQEKRDRLHKKLDLLENELNRRRVRYTVIAGTLLTILGAPGALMGTYDAVVRVTNKIMHELALAKAADDEQRSVSAVKQVQLSPPKRPDAARVEPPQFDGQELEDEIPF
jgi:hypothetical protein